MKALLVLVSILFSIPSTAQTIKLPPAIEKLADTADETVDVTMDASMIRFAERLLSDRKPDQARAKRILRNLKAVYVKTFKFNLKGEYDARHLDAVRSQLSGPEWSRVVEVRSNRQSENVDVFMRTEKGEISGIIVIAAEPRELTIVDLAGIIRPEDLQDLRGVAGIPGWDLASRRKP